MSSSLWVMATICIRRSIIQTVLYVCIGISDYKWKYLIIKKPSFRRFWSTVNWLVPHIKYRQYCHWVTISTIKTWGTASKRAIASILLAPFCLFYCFLINPAICASGALTYRCLEWKNSKLGNVTASHSPRKCSVRNVILCFNVLKSAVMGLVRRKKMKRRKTIKILIAQSAVEKVDNMLRHLPHFATS